MFKYHVMEEVKDGSTGASGGGLVPESITSDPAGSATNGAGAAAASAGADGATDETTKSWLDSLPEDIKKDPSLAMFKEPAALAKSWINAQKMIGANKVVIPDEKASDEEKAAFYQKLGRPDSPDKYELKAPEGYELDDGLVKTFKEAAHKAGLTPNQANAILAFDAQRMAESRQKAEAAQARQMEESLIEYQKSLGGQEKYKATVDRARVALREVGSPELKEFLEESKLGSHPRVIDLFSKIYSMMDEGKIREGTGVPIGSDAATIQAEIEELENPKSPIWDALHPQRESYVQKRAKLYERLTSLQNR